MPLLSTHMFERYQGSYLSDYSSPIPPAILWVPRCIKLFLSYVLYLTRKIVELCCSELSPGH